MWHVFLFGFKPIPFMYEDFLSPIASFFNMLKTTICTKYSSETCIQWSIYLYKLFRTNYQWFACKRIRFGWLRTWNLAVINIKVFTSSFLLISISYLISFIVFMSIILWVQTWSTFQNHLSHNVKRKRQKGERSGFLAPLQLSDALVNFLGTGESVLSRAEVMKRMQDYIKQNNLQVLG